MIFRENRIFVPMMDDFRLKVFITVADEGSFTKAAAVLGVTQPAVSQNIAELERMTGVKLFERLRGEVVLTPQGHVFRKCAETMLASSAMTDSLFTRLSPAVVRISATEEVFSYYIAPALEEFMTVHPEISFERAIFEDADVAIVLKPSPDSVFETQGDSIARIRLSMSRPPKMGDYKATHEKTSYFDLLWQPTQAFACTQICRLLKNYLTSF